MGFCDFYAEAFLRMCPHQSAQRLLEILTALSSRPLTGCRFGVASASRHLSSPTTLKGVVEPHVLVGNVVGSHVSTFKRSFVPQLGTQLVPQLVPQLTPSSFLSSSL